MTFINMTARISLGLFAAMTWFCVGETLAGGLSLHPAADGMGYLSQTSVFNLDASNVRLFAENSDQALESGGMASGKDMVSAEDFEEPFFTANKMHMYLGLGSLLSAGLAAVTAPDYEGLTPAQRSVAQQDKGFHHYAGITAAALGGAAIASGFMFHWDDVSLENGLLDPDNLHMLLGILGTAGYALAVSQAPGGSHSGAGAAGAAAMLVGIYLTW
jgi:hypothetical protein